MLLDRLVCCINDSAIQRRLLAEDKLSFTKAIKISQRMEAATKNAQTLHSSNGVGEVRPGAVHNLFSQQRKSTPATTCYRCGKGGHFSVKFRYKNSKCHSCGKVGHLMKVCRSKPQKQAYDRQGHKSVKCLTKDNDELSENSKEYSLYKVTSKNSSSDRNIVYTHCACANAHVKDEPQDN